MSFRLFSSSFDALLLMTVVYPLAGCAVPVCAVGKTVEGWFMHRTEAEVQTGDVGGEKHQHQHQTSTTTTTSCLSLHSVPEEDEGSFDEDGDGDDTLLTIQGQEHEHDEPGGGVQLRLYNEQGEEGEVRMGYEHECGGDGLGREGWGDSFTSEFSKNYSTATSPASTLPSHFRQHPAHPSVQSLFQTFPPVRVDSPFPSDGEDEDGARSGSATPSAHTREISTASQATSTNSASSPLPSSLSASALAGVLFGSAGRRGTTAYTPFQSLSFHRPTTPTVRVDVARMFDNEVADDDGGDVDGDGADRSADSIDRSEVSTSEEEGGDRGQQVAVVPLNTEPSSLEHPSTPYPFGDTPSPSPSTIVNPNPLVSSAFTFRSPLDGRNPPGEWRRQEAGLITPRASPAIRLHPDWKEPDDDEDGVEKDVRFDPMVGVIGGAKRERENSDQSLPSPPDSHSTSPHTELSTSQIQTLTSHSLLTPSHHPSRAGSTTSTTAVVDDAETGSGRFDDFRVGGEGADEAGLGVGVGMIDSSPQSSPEGKKNKNKNRNRNRNKKEKAAEAAQATSVGGLVESRSLRDGLRSDRPISTLSTSSTHAHLGSPQFPCFLPSSHSRPSLAPHNDEPGSAVSTLRLTPEEVAELVVEVEEEMAAGEEGGHAKEGSGSTIGTGEGTTTTTGGSSPERKLTAQQKKNHKKSVKAKEKRRAARMAEVGVGAVA